MDRPLRDRWPVRIAALAVAALLLLALAFLVLGPAPAPTPSRAIPPATHAPRAELPRAAVRAAAPAERTWHEVRCPLPIANSRQRFVDVLMFTDESGEDVGRVAGELTSDTLTFKAPTAEGAGLVALPDHERGPLVWWTREDGSVECWFTRDPVELPRGTLRFPVRDLPDPAFATALIFRGDTGQPHTLRPTHGFAEVNVPVGEVEVQGCLHWGALNRCGDFVAATVVADRVTDVALDLPDHLPAGIGVETRAGKGGVILTTIRDDTPAEAAGLRAGDVVIAVDGQPVDGDLGFNALVVGPPGTDVSLEVVGADGVTTEVALTRAFVPR